MEDMFIGLGKHNISIKDGVFKTNIKKQGQVTSFFKMLTDNIDAKEWICDYHELKSLTERYILENKQVNT